MAKEFTVIARLKRDEHKRLKAMCREKKVPMLDFVRELVLRAIGKAA